MVIKYLGKKQGGMPVTFPVGCRNRSGIKSVKHANPYLEVTEEEGQTLLSLDEARIKQVAKKLGDETVEPHFAKASQEEYDKWKAANKVGEKESKPSKKKSGSKKSKKAAK